MTSPAVSKLPAQLDRLGKAQPGKYRVVTCYLKLEPRDRARGKYLIKIKNRIKAVENALPTLGLSRPVLDAIRDDLARLHAFLKKSSNLPSTQGLAVFLCQPIGLFEVVPLPRVFRSRLAVDRTPLVRELAAMQEEIGRILTVLLDRTSARLFEVSAFGVTEIASIRADSTRGHKFRSVRGDSLSGGGKFSTGRQSMGGFGERTYNNRIRHEKQRHYEFVARKLFAVNQRQPANGIVLAGIGATAGAIEPFLHPYVADRVIGKLKLSPKQAKPAEVHAATLELREAFERDSERALVTEMEGALGEGWSVNGIRDTLKALARGQVRTLLVNAEASEPGYRCADSGAVVLEPRECRGHGEPIPILDVVDDAIEEALHQRIPVDVIHEPKAREQVEGVAGLLRFR
jgi:peptide chain release factor subunit 1